jgi:hypothetical protein
VTADYGIALFPQHAALLRASAISPDVARARNYQSVDTKSRLASIDITSTHRNVPGLLIPVYGPECSNGEASTWQYRPDHPNIDGKGRPVKYVTAMRGMVIDVPPAVRPHIDDPDRALWITEGIRKVDSAVTAGIDCLGVLGVWNFRGTNPKGGSTALAAWEYIALNARDVYLCFDSDVMVKDTVRKALQRFCGFLEYRKANVRLVILPDVGDGKTGLDDYLAAGGTVDQLQGGGRIIWPAELDKFTARRSTPSETAATVQPDPPPLARTPRILDRLAADAVALGVVGEHAVVATTYLAITSRLLDQQASLAVKGHSASGKSYTVETVVRLFPPDAVCVFTGMSERALIYSEEQYSHRTIVLYEAAALREKAEKTDGNQTAYFLRSLLSEGRISYDVVVKDPDGGFTTKKIVKEGPTNLVLTTTQVHLHGENETRMLSLTTNDSREQTSRVLAALADETVHRVDVDEWQQLQRWLAGAEHRVTVPFARELAGLISPVAVRLRRDFGTLLALIRAHAVLHQLNRPRDDVGRVVASLDDYEVVRALVGPVLSEGVSATVSPTVRETVTAVEQLDQAEGVTAAMIAGHLKLDKSAAYRRLQTAAADGYVQNLEDKRGRPGRWRTAAELPDDVELLPTCNQLHTPVQPPEPPAAPGFSGQDDDGCTVARESQGIERASCTTCGESLDPFWTEQGITVHPGCEAA